MNPAQPTPRIPQGVLASARQGDDAPLVRAVLDLLRQSLAASRVPPQEQEDLIQAKATKLVAILLEGRVAPGKEDGYVWRCGETLAVSHFRKRRDLPTEPAQIEALQAPVEPPGEDDERQDALLEVMQQVMQSGHLSQAHRALLREVYVKQTPPNRLAELDLEAHPVDGQGRPRSFAQARNKIDQTLTRARAALRKQIEEELQRRGS